MSFTNAQKKLIVSRFKRKGFTVEFTEYELGVRFKVKMPGDPEELVKKIKKNHPDYNAGVWLLYGACGIMEKLKKEKKISFITFENTWHYTDFHLNFRCIQKEKPRKTNRENAKSKKPARKNQFGQTPKVGDWIFGKSTGSGHHELVVGKVIGWTGQSIIAENIMKNCDDAQTISPYDNFVLPPDEVGDDFQSFMVMAKLTNM